ncbi:MAG: hypothetical protein WD766_07465 [Gemmatimonadota bacterium]
MQRIARRNVNRDRPTRRYRVGGAYLLLAAVVALLPQEIVAQGLTYSRGQSITPAYEGWELNPDGSRNLVFGYLNRNWEEAPNIPIGANNRFSPGPADRGQPTHFMPRRNRFIFKIPVPADWDEEMVWTLTANGETYTAYASLSVDYFLDNIVIMSENGSLGAGFTDAALRANVPPTAELEGPAQRQVRVGEPLTLAVRATDDGVPDGRRSYRSTVLTEEGDLNVDAAVRRGPVLIVPGKVNGLFVSWFHYRGPGEVTFNPTQISIWEDTRPHSNSPWSAGFYFPEPPADGRWVTRATFSEPGTYLLRGRTDDGGLYTDVEVTVDVVP